VLVGKTAAIQLNERRSWKRIATFVALGIVVVWAIRKWLVSIRRIKKKDKTLVKMAN